MVSIIISINVIIYHTQQIGVRTSADDQVMRLAGADVLQGQQRPVPRRTARPHFGYWFARFDQREDL